MEISFREAKIEERSQLVLLAKESKSHWGMPRERLDEIWQHFSIRPECFEPGMTKTIELEGETVGFYALSRHGEEEHLDHLWLLPQTIGKGIGRLAFKAAIEDAKKLGFETMRITSGPDARGFYERMGARFVEEIHVKEQDAMFPVLEYRIQS